LWALQKEAIRKGSYDADTGPNYNLIRYIVLGVVGFAICVVLSIFSHRTYKRCKSGGSYQSEISSPTESDDYDEDEGESICFPDYSNKISQKDSEEESQSVESLSSADRLLDQYGGLEAGISSPRLNASSSLNNLTNDAMPEKSEGEVLKYLSVANESIRLGDFQQKIDDQRKLLHSAFGVAAKEISPFYNKFLGKSSALGNDEMQGSGEDVNAQVDTGVGESTNNDNNT